MVCWPHESLVRVRIDSPGIRGCGPIPGATRDRMVDVKRGVLTRLLSWPAERTRHAAIECLPLVAGEGEPCWCPGGPAKANVPSGCGSIPPPSAEGTGRWLAKSVLKTVGDIMSRGSSPLPSALCRCGHRLSDHYPRGGSDCIECDVCDGNDFCGDFVSTMSGCQS
jgi:hypothetical protein